MQLAWIFADQSALFLYAAEWKNKMWRRIPHHGKMSHYQIYGPRHGSRAATARPAQAGLAVFYFNPASFLLNRRQERRSCKVGGQFARLALT